MKSFSSKRYLKVHLTKIQTTTKTKCEHCEFANHDKIKLREHIKTSHENKEIMPTQSMDTEATQNVQNYDHLDNLERVSWEEKRMDDQFMDSHNISEDTTINDKLSTQTEELELSKSRDEQVRAKRKRGNIQEN